MDTGRGCGLAGLLSQLRVASARLGSRPRSEQTHHPVHTYLLANTRWLGAGRNVFDHKLPTFSGSYLFRRCLQVRWCSVSALALAWWCFKQTNRKIFADHAGGLWVEAEELVRVRDGVVTSHFELKGLHGFQSISEDPDGSLWVGLRAPAGPLCHVTDGAVKCFGKADGIPISAVNAVLADGKGGFWLGGQGTLVHWHAGVSETYNLGKYDVVGLAGSPDGSVWVGILAEGAGLEQLKEGALEPFVTSTFDGSKLSVTSMMFDRDGNLWVGTDAKGVFRIRGNVVDHYDHTEGLSGDSVWALFEDREGIVWAGTTSGIDSFRDPRVTTFSALQGMGKDLAAGILAGRDGTVWVANAGSLDRIKNGTVSSIRRSDGLPGDQVASLLEDHAGNMWVGVDDGLYLFRKVDSVACLNRITSRLNGGWNDRGHRQNVWAECAANRARLAHTISGARSFPTSQVPPDITSSEPHGGFGSSHQKEMWCCSGTAFWKQRFR